MGSTVQFLTCRFALIALMGSASSLATVSPGSANAQALPSQKCTAQATAAIDAIISQPPFQSAYWGILVEPLATAAPIYARNATHLFTPASNAKLLTTAAALIQLKPTFQGQTPLFATGQPPTLATLRIVGQGDPSLSDSALQTVARQLKAQGVRQIETLVGDNSRLRGLPIEPSWAWEDLQGGDGLPVHSLMVNQNVYPLTLSPQSMGQPLKVQWASPARAVPSRPPAFSIENQSQTVAPSAPEFLQIYREDNRLIIRGELRAGSASETVDVPLPQPEMSFLTRFRDILQAEQIRVDRLVLGSTPSEQSRSTSTIATIQSPRLKDFLSEVNQLSNNLYAEALLRMLATYGSSPTTQSTSEAGLALVTRNLNQLGIASSGYRLVDGSGLSRKNLASPKTLVDVLRAMARSPYQQDFRSSLAVAGRTGTLQGRLQDANIQGKLFAKSGTLQGVSALSGYLETASNTPLIFSILVNHSTQPSSTLQQSIDQIVTVLSELQNCT